MLLERHAHLYEPQSAIRPRLANRTDARGLRRYRSLIFPVVLLLLLASLAGSSVARAQDLFESWPPEVYPIAIESGEVQTFTIPNSFVGKLYVVINGGDGGRSQIHWNHSSEVSAVGASGPGASVDAEFIVGPGPGEIPAGSKIRFIMGRQGVSVTDTQAVYGDVIASGGGGGSAVYVSVPSSPTICDVNSDAPGTLCTDAFECGMGECRVLNPEFPSSCSTDADCGGTLCSPVSLCAESWQLLIGAGGGGGGFAGLFDWLIVPLPISSDGGYARHSGDGDGDTRNGGDGRGSFLNSGDGGVFDPGIGGAGGGGGNGDGGAGGGGTASGGEGIAFFPGGDLANPDFVSPGGMYGSDGGIGWGGGGWGTGGAGGGGGGLSGGGGGGHHGGGGGGGSVCTSEFSTTFCRLSRRANRFEERLPLDGTAAYALSPDQATTVWTVNTNISISQTILSTETWLIEPGVVLTLQGGSTLTIEPGGTLVNSGILLNLGRISNQGDVTNNPSGLINSVGSGEITNTGSITNNGDMYNCIKPLIGTAPTMNPAVRGCLLTPRVSGSSPGGRELCEGLLRGTWTDLDTCTINDFQLSEGLTLDIDAGANLILQGRLTNQGTINNQGTIDNTATAGVLNDCGAYTGLDPTPDPSHACVISPDAALCEDRLGGTWNDPGSSCQMGSATVAAGETLTLHSGYVLFITGTLENFGTLDNYGAIINMGQINNDFSGLINNYGSLSGDLGNGFSVLFNGASVVNFGSIFIDPGGAVFDNAGIGTLINQCDSLYSGAAPINGGAVNGCVTPESIFCTGELEGTWDQFSNVCTILDYTVDAGSTLVIPPGFTLVVLGTLHNLSIIQNDGTITFRDVIFNDEGARLENRGSIFADLVFDGAAVLYNLGGVDNYGSMTIVGAGAVFDNAGLGVLTQKCGSGYTGTTPVNSPSGSVVDETPDGSACEDGDLCTETETCQSGVCAGGSPVTCSPSDQCHDAGTCDPASGVCSDPLKVGGCAYLLGGPGSAITLTSSDLSWEGGAWMADYRTAIENVLNFGMAGVVPLEVVTANLSDVSTPTLAPLDGFIVPHWADTDMSPAQVTAVIGFFLAGGDLIVLQEDDSHDAIGAQLGIPTSLSDGSVSNGDAPFFDGPFGTASDVLQSFVTGRISSSDVASRGGTVAAMNASGEITAAAWNQDEYAPGAGRLLIVADADMWATTTASYAPLNDNGTFALNGTAVAIPEPDRLWLLIAGLGLLGLMACVRANCGIARERAK